MGSPANAAYDRIRKRLLAWPGVRERPEKPGSPLGDVAVKPTIRIGGGRLVIFHRDAARRLHAALRIPDTLANDVPEAEPGTEGQLEAQIDLAERGAAERVEELARRIYRVHTGRAPPAA